MDPIKFPYDTQTCLIQIGSWQYDITRISIKSKNLNNASNTDDFTPNPVWEVINITTSCRNMTDRMPFEEKIIEWHDSDTANELQNEDIVFSIKIKRIQNYYMINNIYPSLILNIISLLAFFLPFATQVSLSKCIFFK